VSDAVEAALDGAKPSIKPRAPTAAASSGETVTVACKMPNGLILRLFRMEDKTIPVAGGGHQTVKQSVATGDEFQVNGPALDLVRLQREGAPDFAIAGGYALTPGIPKDFWDEWLRQNERAQYVQNKIIFAYEKPESARAAAIEHKGVRTGLEPIDPEKPPNDVRRVQRMRQNENSDADNL
jgi:hypothetical protein